MKSKRDEVLEKVDIVDVVSSYVELEKKGQNYNCLCPFHNDNNPSLVVSPEKQIFKCFVCETAGSAIDFVSKFEKIPYNKALKKLADKTGVKIKETIKPNTKYNKVLEDVNYYYTRTLLKSELGEEGLKYLKEKRNLDDEIIQKFQLGFSPSFSNALNNFLIEKVKDEEYSFLEIDELKIFTEKNYDLLNSRITFPIFDKYSNIIGFSGRDLKENSNIKYLNSKDSKLFHKNSVLYNFNNILDNNEDKILLVEGFFDVITAYKYGISFAAATMGTAFGKEHINLLKNSKIKTVYLGFDSDVAGQKALYKAADVLIKEGFLIKVITYGKEKDLDEHLNNELNDPELMIEKAEDLLLYTAKNNIDKLSMDKKISLIEKIKNYLYYYPNDIKKELIVDELTTILAINKDVLLSNTNKTREIKNIEVKDANNDIRSGDKEKVIIYLASTSFEKFEEIEIELEKSNYKFLNFKEEYEKIKKLYESNKVLDIIMLLDEIPRFIEIEKTAKFYGEQNLIDSLSIKNYFNEDSKRKISKLKKLF